MSGMKNDFFGVNETVCFLQNCEQNQPKIKLRSHAESNTEENRSEFWNQLVAIVLVLFIALIES